MENRNRNINENINKEKGGTGEKDTSADHKPVIRGKCLMKNSGLTTGQVYEMIKLTPDLAENNPDAAHYFNIVLDWSNSNSEMKADWLATIRNWIRRDLKDGKIKRDNIPKKDWHAEQDRIREATIELNKRTGKNIPVT